MLFVVEVRLNEGVAPLDVVVEVGECPLVEKRELAVDALVGFALKDDRTPFVVPLTMRVFVRILAARLPSPRTLPG